MAKMMEEMRLEMNKMRDSYSQEKVKHLNDMERLERRIRAAEDIQRETPPVTPGLVVTSSIQVTPEPTNPVLVQSEGKAVDTGTSSAPPMTQQSLGGGEIQTSMMLQPPWRPPEERNNPLTRKLELPLFDEGNVENWIMRADQYFGMGDYSETQKIEAVRLCFLDDALNWYLWEMDRNTFVSWETLKQQVLDNFSSDDGSSSGERLMRLNQTGTVREYCREFIAIASNALELHDSALELAFMAGLRPSIRARMKSFGPCHLEKMMSVAKTVADWDLEEEDNPARLSGGSNSQRMGHNKVVGLTTPAGSRNNNGPNLSKPRNTNTMGSNAASFQGGDKQNPNAHNRVKPPYQKLTPEEIEYRRVNKLCYRCDESWHVRHLCPKKEFTVLVKQTDGSETEWEEPDDSYCYDDDEQEMTTMAELSLNSMVGISSPRTMKLKGSICGQEVVIMIDSGASHNFISQELVKRLVLPFDDSNGYGVMTGTGITVQGREKCKNLKLLMQGLVVTSSFLPLELGTPDVILGMQWLILCCTPVSLKALWKAGLGNGGGVWWDADYRGQLGREKFDGSEIVDNALPGGATPVSERPFRYPQVQKEEIERQVASMMGAGIVKDSRSPFSSHVLLVKKKDGSWRFCVDYRAVNKVTDTTKILVKAEDVPKTAFRTHDGHYEFLVMPFGLKNAPATFQALVNDLFRPHLRRFVLVFFDDILVYSSSLEEHKKHLTKVLQILQDNKLFANPKKCQFGSSEIEYLGHVIFVQGMSTDHENIKAMIEWPEPRNVKALRGLLGLTGYYRKFVSGYGEKARPLTALLKKDQFKWGLEATAAFNTLKMAMTTVPVLALADFNELFIVESDASRTGLGVVLMQKQQPLAFFSQALTERQRLKSVYARELMAIVFAIHKWRHYLLWRKFLVRTDKKSSVIKFLLEQREINLEYQKWLTKILGFDFEIQYKPGLENKAVDALSRKEAVPLLFALSVHAVLQLHEIEFAVDQDPILKKIKEDWLQDASSQPDYTVVQGRLVIPQGSAWIAVILKEFHDGKVGGHGGVLKTQRRITALFYWKGLLQPLPIPEEAWEDISMDFIEGLPKSDRLELIMVVVDRCFTSNKPKTWAQFLPWAELSYNTSYHSTIHMTPFQAVYGREPPTLLRRDVEFAVGDLVYLKLRSYRQQSLARRSNQKLSARYYGPYEVEARIGAVAYKLKLPKESKVHHTFHVSLLKAAIGSSLTPTALPPQLNIEGILEAVPEAVLDARINHRTGQEEVLIKWKGLPDHDNSWEWKGVIEEQFPDLDPEDKVCLKGRGIDTTKVVNQNAELGEASGSNRDTSAKLEGPGTMDQSNGHNELTI
ncbi:hypothetical protein AALP_AA8G165200 [Arabis alpina]|uniref:Chromo domain-containing protein n=1 Tax=Arabis alpina TaxID=50452 RepID=A0A087G7G4_ARAAL|nr:hypothetical protein AALP_AA8G165200 [Arabis alpina]